MKKIMEELQGAKKIGIGGHIRPDGDCVGSCIGLYLYLKKEMPQAKIKLYLEEPSAVFNCLQGVDEIEILSDKTVLNEEGEAVSVPSKVDVKEQLDVFIVLDCAAERLGKAQNLFQIASKRINIDHHISNGNGCGDVNYVVPEASSTSELVYDILEEEKLDIEIAKALYLGIAHDTGVFQYSNTSPKTFNVAGKLIAFGFDFSELVEKTFYEKTYAQNLILGRALLESILFMDGRCIVSCLEKRTMDFYNVGPRDLEGIVSQLRSTKGVDCAIFMYQTGTLEYKVSLRSNGKVNVAKIASFFGGGGHVRAAGCTLNGSFHDAVNNLSLHIEEQMKSTKESNQKDYKL